MRTLTRDEIESVSGGTITSGLVGAGVGALVGIGYVLAKEEDS